MWHNIWVTLPKYINRSKSTQLIRFHFWCILCGNKHEPKSGILLCFCHSTSANYWHATAANVSLFILYQRWVNEYMQILNVAFLRRQWHLRKICVVPYTRIIPHPAELWFDIHYLNPVLLLRSLLYCFFSFSAKPSADLELVGPSLSPHSLDYRTN